MIYSQLPTTSNLFGQQEFAPIMALTWHQPFATLMLHEKIETREWATNHRGKVLICASQKLLNEKQMLEYSSEAQLDKMIEVLVEDPSYYMIGCAIAVGVLFNCRLMMPQDEEKTFVKYKPGLWCHQYRDIRRIDPFEFAGNRKWTVVKDQKTLSQIKFI